MFLVSSPISKEGADYVRNSQNPQNEEIENGCPYVDKKEPLS